ncbi:hypothetical protein RvY_17482-2 [Ramazzottius varieornatus]|nr:hypothetical protein RvY_17482-2 [Ramazzottius varieornatus]
MAPNANNRKSKKQGGKAKRLGNTSAGSAKPARRRNKNAGGKKTKRNGDARATINRNQSQSSRGQSKKAAGRRRQIGYITDARQIISSKQISRGGRAPGAVRSNNVNSAGFQLSSVTDKRAFSEAVRAAMTPVLAPLVRGVQASTSNRPSTSAASAPSNNGPCCLRIANLASSVTLNDLSDLFSAFQGFAGASFDSPGIAIVNFHQRNLAIEAKDEYNNRELDGRTMMIQVDSVGSQINSSRLGPRPSQSSHA